MKTIISNSPGETFQFGVDYGGRLQPGDVVALSGELGTGKTVLAQGICFGIGYRGEVTSPSFVRIHTYPHTAPIYHADLYLLRTEAEVIDLGLDELYGSEAIVIVEWAQRFPGLLPEGCHWIELEWYDDKESSRRITISD